MNNVEQPSGEAQSQNSVPKKEWYKKWWGIIIALLFLPLFATWYIWEKTSWSNKKKGWATVAVVVFSIIIYSDGSEEKSPQQSENIPQTVQTTEATPEAQPVPSVPMVYDIPVLIGKNVDEVTKILGKPKSETNITKEQLELGIDEATNEYKTYEKDGLGLLVTYDSKSKTVSDFFLDGPDKGKLLAQGNLQEKNDAYVVEPVKVMNDPNQITGIRVMKKLPSELNANATFNALAFKVDNLEEYKWYNCKFAINGKILSSGYTFTSRDGIKAKDSIIIPFSEFTKDSKRFDFVTEKPESLFVSCDSLGQHRTTYLSTK